ncbi:MAG TPA: hypothetical protein VNK04_15415 [Gemmataceae bacterium]|jgi:hypothetical protein|nr:hypothetical protein [Gemmataceae bacterium]
MSENNQGPVAFDGRLFSMNRNKIPREELAQHAGKYVAFSLDGTQILVSAEEEEDVDVKLRAVGIDPSRVVHGYIPSPEEHTFL